MAWLTKRLGTPVRAPRLDALGFGLVGGRLLSSEDGPVALLMYEDATGQRVVQYLCHSSDGGRSTAFRFARHDDIPVFRWFDGPLSYGLAGNVDRSRLRAIAEAVYSAVSA